MNDNVINLRQVRKRRERAARRIEAEENRVKHGRKKVERERAAKEAKAQAELLDGHWLDKSREQDQDGAPQDKPDEPKT